MLTRVPGSGHLPDALLALRLLQLSSICLFLVVHTVIQYLAGPWDAKGMSYNEIGKIWQVSIFFFFINPSTLLAFRLFALLYIFRIFIFTFYSQRYSRRKLFTGQVSDMMTNMLVNHKLAIHLFIVSPFVHV